MILDFLEPGHKDGSANLEIGGKAAGAPEQGVPGVL